MDNMESIFFRGDSSSLTNTPGTDLTLGPWINQSSIIHPLLEPEEELLDVPEYIFDKTYVRVIFFILYSLVFCFCFFGNLSVVLVVTLHWKMRNTTKFCLGNLAFANLCVGIFCVYQNLSTYVMDSWLFGIFLCKMYHFINSLSHTASILILVVICIERYLAILHPFRCRQLLTITRLRVVIGAVWVLSAILCSPRLYYMTTYNIPAPPEPGERTTDGGNNNKFDIICAPQQNLYDTHIADMIYFVLLFLLPLLIMSLLYTRVGIFLWRSSDLFDGTNNKFPMVQNSNNNNLLLNASNNAFPSIGSEFSSLVMNNSSTSSASSSTKGRKKSRSLLAYRMRRFMRRFRGRRRKQAGARFTSPTSSVLRKNGNNNRLGSEPESTIEDDLEVRIHTLLLSSLNPSGKESEREEEVGKMYLNFGNSCSVAHQNSVVDSRCTSPSANIIVNKEDSLYYFHGSSKRSSSNANERESNRQEGGLAGICRHNNNNNSHSITSHSRAKRRHHRVNEQPATDLQNNHYCNNNSQQDYAGGTEGERKRSKYDHDLVESLSLTQETTFTYSSNSHAPNCSSSHGKNYCRYSLPNKVMTNTNRRNSSLAQLPGDSSLTSSGSGSTLQPSLHQLNSSSSVGLRVSDTRRRSKSNKTKPRQAVVRMLIVIVVTFAVCNLPFHLRKICQNYILSYDLGSHFSNLITPLTFLLMYLNCAINPILYAFLSKSFRASLKELMSCNRRRRFLRRRDSNTV